jgi:hypothetical protein
MVAAKNSMNLRAACSPASAIAAGTASVLRNVDLLTGAAVLTTAGRLRRSALTATLYPRLAIWLFVCLSELTEDRSVM